MKRGYCMFIKSTLIVFSVMLGCVFTAGAQHIPSHWYDSKNSWSTIPYEYCFIDKDGNKLKDGDMILQSSTVSVRINWEPILIDSIVFDTAYYKYKPGTGHAYEFQLKPEKTTTYKFRMYFRKIGGSKKWSPIDNKFTIHVVDKNGIELRDENEAGYNDKKQKKKYSKRKKRKE